MALPVRSSRVDHGEDAPSELRRQRRPRVKKMKYVAIVVTVRSTRGDETEQSKIQFAAWFRARLSFFDPTGFPDKAPGP
jgi:hypothetical protein